MLKKARVQSGLLPNWATCPTDLTCFSHKGDMNIAQTLCEGYKCDMRVVWVLRRVYKHYTSVTWCLCEGLGESWVCKKLDYQFVRMLAVWGEVCKVGQGAWMAWKGRSWLLGYSLCGWLIFDKSSLESYVLGEVALLGSSSKLALQLPWAAWVR